MVIFWVTSNFFCFMFVLFLYTNDFYFCFSDSWVRTAMTNSGERLALIRDLLSVISCGLTTTDHRLRITDQFQAIPAISIFYYFLRFFLFLRPEIYLT